ncbi:MAG: hypothetical protein COT81_00485 [Candidatus Buchananbacteria bacterium CG10_big_fil_rev_8_21_14_0_10_42_9]|uniref:Uncharacterized protein n=1 Tax=Candidatus Buchananbacteria bacterium CG10_big_fil_rev_8_21_14_0_10_42_9 TaxID=1974526 RepID=A0A2H0W4J5_9BACT|nr:MAG: hypothetical protein COT81_00485 [Candidatus Buchananbacteria bacterium CG10_big_fil_rev_8_21_14_0_10_42_9]
MAQVQPKNDSDLTPPPRFGGRQSFPRPASAPRPKSSFGDGLTSLIIALVIIVGGYYLLTTYTNIQLFQSGPRFNNQWQAVFLSNGQVYFGNITDISRKQVTLENIYYLQNITQPLQRSAADGETGEDANQQLTLVKLGNELHAPEDTMYINRDFVVLMEDLQDEGRVVQAIQRYIDDQATQF